MRREVSTEEEDSRYSSQTPAEMQVHLAPGIFSRLDIGGTFSAGWSPSQPEFQLTPLPLPIASSPAGGREQRPVMAILRSVLLLQRDVPRAAKFYAEGLGLRVATCTERWAELEAGPLSLNLKKVDSEAQLSTGYSPLLSFTVHDLDATVVRMLELGASLDGPIRYPVHGKVAALRGPDGHMLGLYEPSPSDE